MNAKELALSKLNASTKTLGIYIYGISIGIDFRDISKILMSDVGDVIIQLLDSNVFTEDEGYSTVLKVFEYFSKGPSNILKKFDKLRDLDGNIIMSPLR